MLSATATADPARTYAYISDVSVRSSGVDFIKYHCTFTVQVPRTAVDQAPQGAHPELLAGATTAHDYRTTDSHDEFDCAQVEHTWQLVTVDPHHTDRVSISYPAGKPDWLQRILFLVIGLIVLSYAIEKLTGKSVSILHYVVSFSTWRSRRRMARIDKRIAKAREERMPRAQVVETKHDAPPSD